MVWTSLAKRGFVNTTSHIFWLAGLCFFKSWLEFLSWFNCFWPMSHDRRLCQYYTDILRLVWLVSEAIKRNRFGIGKQANRRKQGGIHYKVWRQGGRFKTNRVIFIRCISSFMWRVACAVYVQYWQNSGKFSVSGEFQNRLSGQFLVDGFIFASSSADQSWSEGGL